MLCFLFYGIVKPISILSVFFYYSEVVSMCVEIGLGVQVPFPEGATIDQLGVFNDILMRSVKEGFAFIVCESRVELVSILNAWCGDDILLPRVEAYHLADNIYYKLGSYVFCELLVFEYVDLL